MDETGIAIVFMVLFGVLTWVWADRWGRNPLGWTVAAVFLSPIVVWFVLLCCGKTQEKKVQELRVLKEVMKDV